MLGSLNGIEYSLLMVQPSATNGEQVSEQSLSLGYAKVTNDISNSSSKNEADKLASFLYKLYCKKKLQQPHLK